jgi:hypothetical protein
MVVALGLVLAASNARADEWNKMTKVTFSGPVQVGDTQLAAGTYTFKLMDSLSDRNIVQIFNEDQTKLIATIMAMPDYRLKPTGSTVVKFSESGNGSQAEGNVPDAGIPIKEWFYPGDSFGQEFRVKPVAQTAEAQPQPEPVAEAAPAPVAAAAPAPASADPVPAQQAAPEAAPAPVATPEQSAPADQSKPGTELPTTASDLPMFGLVGVLSLAVAASLRIILKVTA